SIKRGTKCPLIVVALKDWYLITRSPQTSPDSTVKFSLIRLAPIFSRTSIIPVRVGFNPTFSNKILLSGTIRAPTIQKAAEEISPGIVNFFPVKGVDG